MSQSSPLADRPLAIRPPRLIDEAALVDLWIASWREAMPSIDFEARRGFIVDVLRAPGQRILVVTSQEQPVGFATLEGDQLHQLVVAPLAKGHGIASALLDAAKAEASSGLILDVNQANVRAVRFYEREGFIRVASGTNPMSGLATWTMRWTR